MGLAPAAVVVRADEDHRDVELAGLDVGDLEVGRAALGAGAGASAPRTRPRRAPAGWGAAPAGLTTGSHEHDDGHQGRQPRRCRRIIDTVLLAILGRRRIRLAAVGRRTGTRGHG